jgi:hypothetical protein
VCARQRSCLGRVATALVPVAPSRATAPRAQAGSCVSHRLVTSCGKPRSPNGSLRSDRRERGFGLLAAAVSGSPRKVPRARPSPGGARAPWSSRWRASAPWNPALLRGRAGKLALGPDVRASDVRRPAARASHEAGRWWDRRRAGVSSQRDSDVTTRGAGVIRRSAVVLADRFGCRSRRGCSAQAESPRRWTCSETLFASRARPESGDLQGAR